MPDGFISIHKSHAYLSWRYEDHPGARYELYEVRAEGVFTGYVVLRTSRFRVDVSDIALTNMQEYEVVMVLQAIQSLAVAMHKRLVVLGVLENEYWKRILKECRAIKKPMNEAYYLTVKVHQEHNIQPEIYDVRRWICMTGDIL